MVNDVIEEKFMITLKRYPGGSVYLSGFKVGQNIAKPKEMKQSANALEVNDEVKVKKDLFNLG